jgi:aspartate-semialdehyde dehydrogenase
MANKKYNVAVVGATGVVGQEMISVLEQRSFPVAALRSLASSRSAGSKVDFCGTDVAVDELTSSSFADIDIALFSAGRDVSLEFAPIAAKSGAVVIDNSSAFRMEDDVPLVVPEVNPDDVKGWQNRGIIANPNCSTIQFVVAAAPLHSRARITRAVVDTYQSVSGAGSQAMSELNEQTSVFLAGGTIKSAVFPHQIAFSCIPHIDVFEENGFTREEMKIVRETKKILGDQSIKVTATAVRVPVFIGHSEAVSLEFEKEISPEEARSILSSAPGVAVIDDVASSKYPLAPESAGTDDVFVGRIRRDPTVKHGLQMWIVADNLRKGAALNAVQIAELVVKRGT